MSTIRLMLLTEIEESKCGACGELSRKSGLYCMETRQRLDSIGRHDFDNILLHCEGSYPLRQPAGALPDPYRN